MNFNLPKAIVCENVYLFLGQKLCKNYTLLKLTGKVHQSASILDIIISLYKEKYKYRGGKVSSPQVHFKFIYIGLMFTNLGSKFTFRVWKE